MIIINNKYKLAYDKLWNILSEKRNTIISDNLLTYDSKNVFVELTMNDHYEYQVYIATNSGFSTIGIYVLLDNVEDYIWCWKQLNKINIRKGMIR